MQIFNPDVLAGKVIVVTGHFGCGKTNISVNLASAVSHLSRTYLIDYDNVNPYFRALDAKEFLRPYSVKIISSEFANTNVDIPSVSPLVYTALSDSENGASVVIDLGGDMTGAVSLGALYDRLKKTDPVVLYVFSAYRPLTDTPEKAYEVLRSIEDACGFHINALINNSNIGNETLVSDIEATAGYAETLSRLSKLDVIFTSYMTDTAPSVCGSTLKIKNMTKKLF